MHCQLVPEPVLVHARADMRSSLVAPGRRLGFSLPGARGRWETCVDKSAPRTPVFGLRGCLSCVRGSWLSCSIHPCVPSAVIAHWGCDQAKGDTLLGSKAKCPASCGSVG